MPDRVPDSWQVHCTFMEASDRPPYPAQVSLNYRSEDGHHSVSISQMAADDRAASHYGTIVGDENWREVTVDGTTVSARPSEWGQAQVHLEREGTFVFVVSDNLTTEEVATIAAGLRPAPSSAGI
jgi:hypothetical protein